MQLVVILNQDETILKWGEAALSKEADRTDALNSFLYIHLFFGHVT